MQLELNDLRKTYLLPAPLLHRRGQGKPKTKQALAGVSITLGPGLYGLLGPNGAGKSTLIGIITGGLAADSGEVLWCGRAAHGIAFRRVLGYMPQQQGLYDSYTGRRFLAYMAALKEIPRAAVPGEVARVAAAVNLTDELDKRLAAYSGGMKQRLLLAAALLGDPKLLILDEPTNGLDPIGIAEVRNFIKNLSVERGKTILISSHILSEISLLADDIGIIDHGVLLEESSMEELEKKNRKYIQLQVSDIPKASLILERQFHVTDYAVQDEHNLRLYDTALDMAAINKALVVQDVAVISSQICNDTLEDYFKQITGGEGIA